jgi:hypothetical protein
VLQILLGLIATRDSNGQGRRPFCHFQLPWAETPRLLRMLSYEQIDAARFPVEMALPAL